ncbi:MAG: flagellar assembly protein FliW [Bacillota bacterium]
MKVVTKRFGTLEVDPGSILTFPEGLIGFPDCRDFVVVDYQVAGDCVRWLQSVTEPALGFVTLDPKAVFPDYDPEFCPTDLELLDSKPDELVLLSVVTVPRDVRRMTANLQAPLVINPKKRVARQVITTSPEYTTKHYVFSALSSLSQRTG